MKREAVLFAVLGGVFTVNGAVQLWSTGGPEVLFAMICMIVVVALCVFGMCSDWVDENSNGAAELRMREACGYRRAMSDCREIMEGGRVCYTADDLAQRLENHYVRRYAAGAVDGDAHREVRS